METELEHIRRERDVLRNILKAVLFKCGGEVVYSKEDFLQATRYQFVFIVPPYGQGVSPQDEKHYCRLLPMEAKR